METPQAYPLQWPNGAPRTRQDRRTSAKFQTTLNGALKNVSESVRKFGNDTNKKIDTIVLSSNCALGQTRPADPGVAVWFIWDSEWRCIPVDRYSKPEWNLQAIHHVLEARRTEFRHGGLHIAKAAFSGFTPAIEGPGTERSWRVILQYGGDENPGADSLKERFRRLSKTRHPDSETGSTAAMSELNVAYQAAQKELN